MKTRTGINRCHPDTHHASPTRCTHKLPEMNCESFEDYKSYVFRKAEKIALKAIAAIDGYCGEPITIKGKYNPDRVRFADCSFKGYKRMDFYDDVKAVILSRCPNISFVGGSYGADTYRYKVAPNWQAG